MVDFKNTIIKAIGDYKVILRKTLSVPERKAKMHSLGIVRKHIQDFDKVYLYKIGLRIIEALKKDVKIHKDKKSNNVYLGAEEFLRYLEDFLAKYRVEDNEVLHVGQMASCALVEAMQLIMFSKDGLQEDEAMKIRDHADVIASYGSEEQKKMLVNVVHLHQGYLVKHLPKELSVYFS